MEDQEIMWVERRWDLFCLGEFVNMEHKRFNAISTALTSPNIFKLEAKVDVAKQQHMWRFEGVERNHISGIGESERMQFWTAENEVRGGEGGLV